MRYAQLNVAVDIDGVLNMFDGWDGYYHDELVRPGAREFLEELSQHFRVVLFTARPDVEAIYRWLHLNGLSGFVDEVTREKVPAIAYIDDRGIHFDGSFDGLVEKILAFKPHWAAETEKQIYTKEKIHAENDIAGTA